MRTLLALVQDPVDRATIVAARGPALTVRLAASLIDLEGEASHEQLDTIVYEVGVGWGPAAKGLENCARFALATPGIWLRGDLSARCVNEIVAIAKRVPGVALLLRRFDRPLDEVLRRLTSPDGAMFDHRGCVLHRLGQVLPEDLVEVVAAAMVLGSYKASVDVFSQRLSGGHKTLESRLADHRTMRPNALLRWALALSVQWKFERTGTSLADLARNAGFSDAGALSEAIQRATGRTPVQWERAGGFEALLEAFAAALSRAGGLQ